MTSLKTSIKTITYLSDIGCLEIQGASLLCIFIIRLLDKDFIEAYKKTLKNITALHILLMVLSVTGIV